MQPDDFEERMEMYTRLTPPLSPEGIAEIEAELAAPPADTPERRATFELARKAQFLVDQVLEQERRMKRKK